MINVSLLADPIFLKEMKIKIAPIFLIISLAFMLSGCMIGDMYYRLPRGRRDVTVIILFILIYWMIRILIQSLKGKKKKK
jgi:hypothetical protein